MRRQSLIKGELGEHLRHLLEDEAIRCGVPLCCYAREGVKRGSVHASGYYGGASGVCDCFGKPCGEGSNTVRERHGKAVP